MRKKKGRKKMSDEKGKKRGKRKEKEVGDLRKKKFNEEDNAGK